MTSPVIEHLDAFEEEIVAIAMRHITLDRAVMREIEAHRRREAEEDGWTDWYAEERASRTGGA